MSKVTPTNVGRNSVLLFGDYGTEIMRLSQLYDPKKDRYQKNTDKYPVEGTTYYTLVKRDRTIEFEPIAIEKLQDYTYNLDGSENAGKFKETAEIWKDTGNEATCGYYVPVPQTLVVVDNPTTQWGTYTLLIVDSVDEETYESKLVPINFTGSVDTAVRAVDWNNNLLSLYVEKIEDNGTNIFKLTPDRKILAYGSGDIRYVVTKRMGDGYTRPISAAKANASDPSFTQFVSAASFVNYRVAKVTNKEDFEELKGQLIEYYNSDGIRIGTSVDIEEIDGIYSDATKALYNDLVAAYNRGDVIRVYPKVDVPESVTRVQLPESSYLTTDTPALTIGEDVYIDVYEAAPGTNALRLITTYRCIVRDGSPINPADLTQGQIVGFDVMLQGVHDSGIWEIGINADGSRPSIKELGLQPVLTLDDGRVVDVSTLKDLAFFQYGLERLKDSKVGTEFNVLFKYYPGLAVGVKRSVNPNTRYIKVTDTSVAPNADQRYFSKVEGSADEFILAENDGHPKSFDPDKTYYTRVMKFSWQSAVNRPSRDFITCTKRVRMVEGVTESVRKISVIPIWNNDTESWSLKYLVYKNDYLSPKLLDCVNAIEHPTYTEDHVVIPKDEPDLTVTYDPNSIINRFDVYYRKANATEAITASKTGISLMLQHFTAPKIGEEKFLIGGKAVDMASTSNRIYGRNGGGDIRRPYILCTSPSNDKDAQVYRIPVDDATGFPLISTGSELRNTFVENFFDAAITDEESTQFSADGLHPTHFRIRSISDNNRSTEWLAIDADPEVENDLGYGNPVVVNGLNLPDPAVLGCMGIVIVEFAHIAIDDTVKVLNGVPVEVRTELITGV